MLDAVSDDSGFADPSTRISSDGRTIVFSNPTSGTRQFLDAATGATLFHPRDSGGRIALDGIDAIASLATRRAASGK